ncbi:unnamed protein product [Caenorhabditis auriculariae]|uniref:G-protein coupled receptors family 1 profile domain-containing protein n=1 Tax=Caenorhabditis auriculariae TaxID=2777116 RepID=A0A8S1HDK4_9PELO|nr:unnamed protein product [Caenorhabditis auriculariae]
MDDAELLLREWAMSSRLLYFSVLGVSSFTLPALVFSLASMKRLRKSNTKPFLCVIMVANIVLLTAVLTNVLSEQFNLFVGVVPGVIVCKLSTFLVNTSSSTIHWTWVAMYLQRFLHVFFPMRARRSLSGKSKNIIFAITLFSSLAEVWTLILMTEIRVPGEDDGQSGSYCAENPRIIGKETVKWVASVDCFLTFFLPLLLTVLTDMTVLVLRNPCQKNQFKLVSSKELGGCEKHECTMKIVSESNRKSAAKRRSLAIRRCFIAATITLLLNLPNYVLQIDAAVYVLYLLQFPTVPIHMLFLREDISRASRYRFHSEQVHLQFSDYYVHQFESRQDPP